MTTIRTISIAINRNHLISPFNYKHLGVKTHDNKTNLTKGQKIASIALAILFGLPTFGIGGVAAFYLATAYFKSKTAQKIIDLNPLSPPSGNTPPPIGMPLPPADGLKMQMINLGASCWFNTTMKIMASTNAYDYLLNLNVDRTDHSPEQQQMRKEIQTKLKDMVQTIRSASPGSVVDRGKYIEVLTALDRAMPGKNYLNHANNPSVFIKTLTKYLSYGDSVESWNTSPPDPLKKDLARCLTVIKNKATGIKTTQRDEYRLDLSLAHRCSLGNIGTALVEFYEGTPLLDWQILPIYLPENLHLEANLALPPNIDPASATIELLQYDEFTQLPKKKCVYQLQGFYMSETGHATYVERAGNGQYIFHDDMLVQSLPTAQALSKMESAAPMYFKLLSKTPV